MAKLIFDVETSALPLEHFDEAQQEYVFRNGEKLPDDVASEARRDGSTSISTAERSASSHPRVRASAGWT